MHETPIQIVAYATGSRRGRQDEQARMPWRDSVGLTRGALRSILLSAHPKLPGICRGVVLLLCKPGIQMTYNRGYRAARYRVMLDRRTSQYRLVRGTIAARPAKGA